MENEIKIGAVLSLPRITWTCNSQCIYQHLMPLNIPVHLGGGAYWHHTICNLMKNCVDDGTDIILTLDYDTVFTKDDVQNLLNLMETEVNSPWAEKHKPDIVAALQMKRGNGIAPMFRPDRHLPVENGVCQLDSTAPLIPISQAHFGLTMIRASALAKLSKPWMIDVPDKNGEYLDGDSKIDPDIYFWRNCENAKLNMYVAPQVKIGHVIDTYLYANDDFTGKLLTRDDFERDVLSKQNGIKV